MLSIAVVAALALAIGGSLLMARRRDRTRGVLMLVAGLVLMGNVLIWVIPVRPQ